MQVWVMAKSCQKLHVGRNSSKFAVLYLGRFSVLHCTVLSFAIVSYAEKSKLPKPYQLLKGKVAVKPTCSILMSVVSEVMLCSRVEIDLIPHKI